MCSQLNRKPRFRDTHVYREFDAKSNAGRGAEAVTTEIDEPLAPGDVQASANALLITKNSFKSTGEPSDESQISRHPCARPCGGKCSLRLSACAHLVGRNAHRRVVQAEAG